MKRLLITTGMSVALLCSGNALAEGIGLGIKVGSLGAGIEVTKGLSDNFNARLGFNTFTLDESGTESDINYAIDLELSNATLLLDWHPTGGSFRTTAGLVANGNELKMTAESAASYDIGGTTYTPADIGTLSGVVGFDELVPYLGIGWGNAVEDDQKLTFSFDIGVVFQGSPNVALSTTSTVAGLEDDLRVEEQQLEQDLDKFDLYPVVSLGLAWQF